MSRLIALGAMAAVAQASCSEGGGTPLAIILNIDQLSLATMSDGVASQSIDAITDSLANTAGTTSSCFSDARLNSGSIGRARRSLATGDTTSYSATMQTVPNADLEKIKSDVASQDSKDDIVNRLGNVPGISSSTTGTLAVNSITASEVWPSTTTPLITTTPEPVTLVRTVTTTHPHTTDGGGFPWWAWFLLTLACCCAIGMCSWIGFFSSQGWKHSAARKTQVPPPRPAQPMYTTAVPMATARPMTTAVPMATASVPMATAGVPMATANVPMATATVPAGSEFATRPPAYAY